jgi:hypothetical protein
VLTLLSPPSGTTIKAIMEATGFQAHSVRGFLAGVVRKKLAMTLQSEKTDGERVYRVIGGGANPRRPEMLQRFADPAAVAAEIERALIVWPQSPRASAH